MKFSQRADISGAKNLQFWSVRFKLFHTKKLFFTRSWTISLVPIYCVLNETLARRIHARKIFDNHRILMKMRLRCRYASQVKIFDFYVFFECMNFGHFFRNRDKWGHLLKTGIDSNSKKWAFLLILPFVCCSLPAKVLR